MKRSFGYILGHANRKLVMHEYDKHIDVLTLLQPNDILFLDDCVFSQYEFVNTHIVQLKALNITIVLGFSTRLHRNMNEYPTYDTTANLHKKYHYGDMTSLNGFMTIQEIKELLSYDNVYIANHGANHLNLSEYDYLQAYKKFKDDIDIAIADLDVYGIHTNIFVYPYSYEIPLMSNYLKHNGYIHIFAGKSSKRISIEALNDKFCKDMLE